MSQGKSPRLWHMRFPKLKGAWTWTVDTVQCRVRHQVSEKYSTGRYCSCPSKQLSANNGRGPLNVPPSDAAQITQKTGSNPALIYRSIDCMSAEGPLYCLQTLSKMCYLPGAAPCIYNVQKSRWERINFPLFSRFAINSVRKCEFVEKRSKEVSRAWRVRVSRACDPLRLGQQETSHGSK